MRAIAFYGKGGIGKSTTLSNVIAALSTKGKKVLQIGCDPKHDSTRLLLGGFTPTTVLEQFTAKGIFSLESVMFTGYNGVKCIEAGGPEPGVGCAGRGIIQTLHLLNDRGLDTKQFDYVFFDVLGDVVCGGFAVPMRDGYADEVYIVTSGEVASLYAANNIAKGLLRYTAYQGKLGGIIGNERVTKNERDIISAFAKRIGTEMVAFIPKSELVSDAELYSKTIIEYAPHTDLAKVYSAIASYIEQHKSLVIPKPLSSVELDEFFREFCYTLKLDRKTSTPLLTADNPTLSRLAPCTLPQKPITKSNKKASFMDTKNREPIHGCSLSGAFNVLSQIKDTIALMYSPKGCSYISFCTQLNRIQQSYSIQYLPNLLCTNMSEKDVIFGGTTHLKETLKELTGRFPKKAIFLITSCPAGIIGDDIYPVINEFNTEEQQIFHIPSDGVMGGDFYAGMLNAYKTVAKEFIDNSVIPEKDSVNLIGEQNLSTTADQNFLALTQLLTSLGLKINCRFIRYTNLTEIKKFKKAKINIPIINEPTVKTLIDYLNTNFNTETLEVPLPIAFEQTTKFIRTVANHFGKEALAEKIIKEAQISYDQQIALTKNSFKGKKALIFNSSGVNIDWLIRTLIDLEVNITKIYDSNFFYPPQEPKKYGAIAFESMYPVEKYDDAVRAFCPDFVLTAMSTTQFNNVVFDTFPVNPLYGFYSGIEYAKKLQLKLRIPFREGWRIDEQLF